MKAFKAFGVAFLLICVALSIPPIRLWVTGRVLIPAISPRFSKNYGDSKLVLNKFYVHSQAKNYAQAHQLLSSNLRRTLSIQDLKQQWQTFEQVHGSIRNWQSASGGKTNMWPDYVDFNHTVTGTKSGAGKVSVRMVPGSGTWRIAQLNIRP